MDGWPFWHTTYPPRSEPFCSPVALQDRLAALAWGYDVPDELTMASRPASADTAASRGHPDSCPGTAVHEIAHPPRGGAAKPRGSRSQPGYRMERTSHVLGRYPLGRRAAHPHPRRLLRTAASPRLDRHGPHPAPRPRAAVPLPAGHGHHRGAGVDGHRSRDTRRHAACQGQRLQQRHDAPAPVGRLIGRHADACAPPAVPRWS